MLVGCHQLFVSVQVCSVLESLEQEYRRDEDWCGSHDKLGTSADSDHLVPLISKHLEQKEAFLKVIHHVRKQAAVLLHRCTLHAEKKH